MLADFIVLLIPLIFVSFIYYVVYDDVPHLHVRIPKMRLPTTRLTYAEYMAKIDERIAEDTAKYTYGMQKARELERGANARLMAMWVNDFVRETDLKHRWQQRRELWHQKALEFRAAQTQIKDNEMYWVLGARSFEATKIVQKLVSQGSQGWYLSLYLENCHETIGGDSIFVEKQRLLRYISDPELRSFVMNRFDYSELADYAPYYGTKTTRFDMYLEFTKTDVLPELEAKKEKNYKRGELSEAEVLDEIARRQSQTRYFYSKFDEHLAMAEAMPELEATKKKKYTTSEIRSSDVLEEVAKRTYADTRAW